MGKTSGSSSESLSPQQLMEQMGAEVGMEIPDFVKEITPALSSFFKKALTNQKWPTAASPKAMRGAINTMGKVLYESVLEIAKEPADLFYLPYKDIMEKSWQGLLDFAESYSPKLAEVTTPERKAFGKYEAGLRTRFEALAAGKGYAMDEMEAMFRDEMKEVKSRALQRVNSINRLSSSDPRMAKSKLMDLEIAKGGWVQDARDKNMARQAEMRLKSEFFGAEKLLDLAKFATAEEQDFNKINMAADQLRIEKGRIEEQLKLTGKGMIPGALSGLMGVGMAEQEAVAKNEALRTGRLNQLLSTLGVVEDMWRYGRDYPLRAAAPGAQFAGTGLSFAANKYAADIGRYAGYQSVQDSYNPWASILGTGMGIAATAPFWFANPAVGATATGSKLIGDLPLEMYS